MRAVADRKRVVDVNIADACHLGDESGLVARLAGFEARVLEQRDIARPQHCGAVDCALARRIGNEHHLAAEHMFERAGDHAE